MTTLMALRAPKWHVHEACLCPVRLTCAITALTTGESYGVWAAGTNLTAKH